MKRRGFLQKAGGMRSVQVVHLFFGSDPNISKKPFFSYQYGQVFVKRGVQHER